MKKNRLIALIDFSLYSNALIELAYRWCQVANAELLLVHSVPGLVPAMTDVETREKVIEGEKEEALSKLTKLSKEKKTESIHVEYLVTDRSLLNLLPGLLGQGYNDFVLVGVKGTGMLKKILIGSTATKIIDELNHTAIALPSRLCTFENKRCNMLPEKLIVALNYKYPLNEEAFSSFIETFKSSIKRIEFVSMIYSDETEAKANEYLINLSSIYKDRFPVFHKVFPGKDIFDEIKEYVCKNENTILVVQKGSRSLIDQLFREFLINKLVHDGSIPLVVIP